MRAKRAARVLACATRIASSYVIEVARDDRADPLVRGDRGEAREIPARVPRVLIVDETRERELGDGADRGGKRREIGVHLIGGPLRLPPNPVYLIGGPLRLPPNPLIHAG